MGEEPSLRTGPAIDLRNCAKIAMNSKTKQKSALYHQILTSVRKCQQKSMFCPIWVSQGILLLSFCNGLRTQSIFLLRDLMMPSLPSLLGSLIIKARVGRNPTHSRPAIDDPNPISKLN